MLKPCRLYIVILNYKSWQDTIECLETIFKLNYQNLQVIVIDNSPDDNSISNIKLWAKDNSFLINSKFPELVYPLASKPIEFKYLLEENLYDNIIDDNLVLIKAKNNNGFAAGNNIALKYIRKFANDDEVVWLLNNDTVIKPDTAAKIMNESLNFKNNILYGMPLIDYVQKNTIQAIGGKYIDAIGICRHVGENLPIKENLNFSLYKTDYPVGASLILSVSFLSKVGLLSEDYFLYFEELDWVRRAEKLGGGHKILNILGVYHKQGVSTDLKKHKKNVEIDLIARKSTLTFVKKHSRENLLTVKLFMGTIFILFRMLQGNFNIVPRVYKLLFKR